MKIRLYLTTLASYIIESIALLLLYPIAKIKYRGKNPIIVSERGDDARDNGYHMFCYLRKNHPEIDAYYIIDFASTDYQKVQAMGNVVQYKSLQHYLLFYASKIRMSTHVVCFSPNPQFYLHLYKIVKPKKVINISLKHGITKDNIQMLNKKNTNLDLIIAGAKPEYDFLKKEFGYSDDEIAYTGFARFDNLVNEHFKKQILVMPTWRKYLQGLTNEQFMDTDFYQSWNNLLTDQKFLDFLDTNDILLVFYLHYYNHTTHNIYLELIYHIGIMGLAFIFPCCSHCFFQRETPQRIRGEIHLYSFVC